MAEDVTEPVGRFAVSVLLVHATHSTEVRHEVLQSAGVMARQSADQNTQSRLTLLRRLHSFTPSSPSHTLYSELVSETW